MSKSVQESKSSMQEMVHNALFALVDSLAYPGKSNDRIGQALHKIYIWQEIADIAEQACKLGWKAAQSADGFMDSDEALRNELGERLIATSRWFNAVVKVDASRNNFDRDAFIASVVAKYNLPLAPVAALAENSKKPSASPIRKYVVAKS